jgi:radical SAM superfamily enzyme YgiQ (UPF0313 family)
MLLIYPPLAKPGEPPAGIARLAGALNANNIPCRVLDANLEGILHLLNETGPAGDTWSRRAIKNVSRNIDALRDPRTYRSLARYSRAVRDVDRALQVAAGQNGVRAGLSDYQDDGRSPVRSADLIAAAEHPEESPFFPYFERRLPAQIEHEDEGKIKDVIGFSLNYLSQALTTFAMIGFVRREFPGAEIVLGGGLVTSWMKRPGWNNPFRGLVDHLIAGPGERPLLTLFGVEESELRCSVPDYGSFPHEAYLSPGFILPYSGSSGCYWHECSFCPETAEGNTYVPVPPGQAMAELAGLIRSTAPVLVHLLDNAISPSLMRALAERPLPVPWYGFARISRDLADPEYGIALRRAGCVMLKLGLESGDQGVLDNLRKGIELETASRVLRNLHRAGIAAYVYLLFGTPAETETEARKTLAFVVRHREAISYLNLAIFNLPVCADEARELAQERFYEGDLSLYTGFTHPRGWDRKQVRLFLDNEFKRNTDVAAILKQDPPIFTSNHAAFFPKG